METTTLTKLYEMINELHIKMNVTNHQPLELQCSNFAIAKLPGILEDARPPSYQPETLMDLHVQSQLKPTHQI